MERYERPTIRKMNAGLMNKFGTKTENEPVTHIESVSVKKLLSEYGFADRDLNRPHDKSRLPENRHVPISQRIVTSSSAAVG